MDRGRRPPSTAATVIADSLHNLTGYAGGVGYAALAGLIAVRVAARPGRVVTALAALGQRSLTGYLTQSVVFAADLMRQRGCRGPAELVLSRLTYGMLNVGDGMTR